mmetsp:Transcript_27298/g.72325  ORF Transcript_27298/g.72325 Transcript_27298/m.72325 type:complete len:542 (+) Transcript_27298:61-1686(+)
MVAARGERTEEAAPPISYLGFNQDQTCLAVGTWSGFKIFSTENFTLLHEEACGPVSLVEMLFRTSLLALVGCSSAEAPSSSSRELTMWNTKERCNICQLHFNSRIHGVKMNHRRAAVLLQQKIHIFDLKTMRSLHVVERAPSDFVDPALGWLCAASERGYLATPLALTSGCFGNFAGGAGGALQRVRRHCAAQSGGLASGPLAAVGGADAEARLGLVTVLDTYTLKPVGTAFAHRSPIQALCINPTGQLLATASSKGTVVRLFGLPALDLLYSFRRGTSPCRVFGLLFSRDSALVCASASSGTVHVFRNSEKVLGALPLESQDSTVGAAQREMAGRPAAESEDNEGGEFDDWDLVPEQPDRLLERMVNVPSHGESGGRTSKSTLQKLTAVSSYTAEHTARYAKSLLQMLPQECRQLLLDSPRAFAWVHLRDGDEEQPHDRCPASRNAELLAKMTAGVLGGDSAAGERMERYVACVLPGRGGHAEVLAVTPRGSARVYDWNPSLGGECRLRLEEKRFAGQRLARGELPPQRSPGRAEAAPAC